jgi:hypothetical protein
MSTDDAQDDARNPPDEQNADKGLAFRRYILVVYDRNLLVGGD